MQKYLADARAGLMSGTVDDIGNQIQSAANNNADIKRCLHHMLPLNTRAALIIYRPAGVVKRLLEPRLRRQLQSYPFLLPPLRRLSNRAQTTLTEAGLTTVLVRAYVNLTTSVSNSLRATLLRGSVVAGRPLVGAIQSGSETSRSL